MFLKKSLIKKSDKILIAFSGGKDSVVLLDLLLKSFEKSNIAIAHINHEIRENSSLDARFSQDIAKKYGILYFQKNLGLKNISSNIEAVARDNRYNALIKIAKDNSFNKIATAHTKSDNIEQFFIKLYRGSSLSGLGGISEARDMIIRPLLAYSSEDIKAYIKNNNLSHIEDETNAENLYLRNKIRNTILPKINIENYDLHTHIINLMTQIEKDNLYFNNIINEFIDKNVHIFNDFLFFDKSLLLNLPESIKTRLIHKLLYQFFNTTSNFNKIMEIIKEDKEKLQVSSKVDLFFDNNFISIVKNNAKTLNIKDTERLFSIIKDKIKFFRACETSDLFIDENIQLINFTTGDKFQKYNNKTVKLKDVFIDHKIPIFLRRLWPLLSLNNEVIALAFLEKGYYYNPKNSYKQ